MQDSQLWTIFIQEEKSTPAGIPVKRSGSIKDPTHVMIVYVDIEAKGMVLVSFVV
jgi:hypothetical protein